MKLRSLYAASAFAILICSSPAVAQPIGEFGLSYSGINLEAFDLEGDGTAISGEGSVLFLNGPIGAQLDANLTNFDADDEDASVFSATGHLKYNSDAQWAGAFLGVNNNEEASLWGLGLEGKSSTDAGSIYLQLGYGRADDLDEVDMWAVRAEGRLFISDNLRLGLNGGFTRAEDDVDNLDLWNVGVDAEYQITNTPFSVFASYERGEAPDLELSADTFRIGGKVTFGGSLRDRDRYGAGQGSVSSLFGGSLGSAVIAVAGEIIE